MAASDTSDIISDYVRLLRRSPSTPEIAASSLSTAFPKRDMAVPCALILSPHPDDECLSAALPLRLKHENNWQIINVAITLGSNTDRRAQRKIELANACATLGFQCVLTDSEGFSAVSQDTRKEDALAWANMVNRLSQIISHCKPQAIFLPHDQDAHPAHIGTHLLGMDAFLKQKNDFITTLVLTEYWQPIEEPNIMIGVDEEDATKMLSALACHTGENARNPFDVRFPAYLIDNVRRGSERVGSKGVNSALMDFAVLYKFGLWRNGKFIPSALKRILGVKDGLSVLFD